MSKIDNEKVIIDIDPDNCSYVMNTTGCSLERLIWVIGDIHEKLSKNEFGPEVQISDYHTGEKLTRDDIAVKKDSIDDN